MDFLFGQEDMIEAIQIPGAEVYYDEHFLKPEGIESDRDALST